MHISMYMILMYFRDCVTYLQRQSYQHETLWDRNYYTWRSHIFYMRAEYGSGCRKKTLTFPCNICNKLIVVDIGMEF